MRFDPVNYFTVWSLLEGANRLSSLLSWRRNIFRSPRWCHYGSSSPEGETGANRLVRERGREREGERERKRGGKGREREGERGRKGEKEREREEIGRAHV